MNNVITLEFDRTLNGLAGYDFGVETYHNQVEGKIDLTKKVSIKFPDNIQMIASSFTQGFFEKIVEEIGISGIEQNVEIIAAKEEMKENIIKNLM